MRWLPSVVAGRRFCLLAEAGDEQAAAGTAVASMKARSQVEPASVPAPSVWIRPRT